MQFQKELKIFFFNSLSKLCIKKKTIIMMEFRTIKDPLIKKGRKISCNERFTNHYRRFIDVKIYLDKNSFLKEDLATESLRKKPTKGETIIPLSNRLFEMNLASSLSFHIVVIKFV